MFAYMLLKVRTAKFQGAKQMLLSLKNIAVLKLQPKQISCGARLIVLVLFIKVSTTALHQIWTWCSIYSHGWDVSCETLLSTGLNKNRNLPSVNQLWPFQICPAFSFLHFFHIAFCCIYWTMLLLDAKSFAMVIQLCWLLCNGIGESL